MAIYQDRAKERIKDGVRKVRGMCKTGVKRNFNEADTRTIVLSTLVNLLGWDAVEEVSQEQAKGKRGFCDFLLSLAGEPYAIIEVKPIGAALNDGHAQQAQNYAQAEGIEWVVTTNGDEWNVFRLVYDGRKGSKIPVPRLAPVARTSFLDTQSIKPAERVEALYLLSKEAAAGGELAVYHDGRQALEPQELVKRLPRKDVVDRVRIGLKNDTGLKITNKELAARIAGIVVDTARPSNLRYWVERSE